MVPAETLTHLEVITVKILSFGLIESVKEVIEVKIKPGCMITAHPTILGQLNNVFRVSL